MITDQSVLRDILRLFIWFPFRWLARIIHVDSTFFLLKCIGDLHFSVGGQKKRRVLHRMQSLLHSDKNLSRTVRAYYENHYADRLHILLYPKLGTWEKLASYVCFENLETVNHLLSTGRGILMVQPHFGPVQITLLALALHGYDPIQIGYPTDKGLSRIGRSVAFRYRLKYEAMLPAPIIPADGYLGEAYKHLKKGGIVLTTGDGAGGGSFLGDQRVFKFLGIDRKIPLGPATWAIKTGAALVPTFIISETYNRFKIVFAHPIEGIYNNIEKDKVYITERFIACAEDYIRKYPHCWHFWDEIQDY